MEDNEAHSSSGEDSDDSEHMYREDMSKELFYENATDTSESEEPSDTDLIPTLQEVIEEYLHIKTSLVSQQMKLSGEAPSRDVIYEVKSSLATLNGDLEDLEYDLDALSLTTREDKAQRKHMVSDLADLFDSICALDNRCQECLRKDAERKRALGNDCFKSGHYSDAVTHYTSAIGSDSSIPLLFTNRALAFQKLGKFDEAIDDAKTALGLDVNFLKAYVILVKCLLTVGSVAMASETLDSVPIASQQRTEVADLKTQTAAAAKESGNACFKKGEKEEAVKFYTIAIHCTPENHLLYSNRSAAYQSRGMWKEALKDGERCVHLCEKFPKGYVHMGRAQVQLQRWSDAESTVNMASTLLAGTPELESIAEQLNEIRAGIQAGKHHGRRNNGGGWGLSDSEKAEQFKARGNAYYKSEDYEEAVRFYTQAISLCPNEGPYYGNRAAAWLMMKEYKRAIADCLEGIAREKTPGLLDKLRMRRATALAAMGSVDEAISVLEEALRLEGRQNDTKNMEQQLERLRGAVQSLNLGQESLQKGEFSRARRLFESAQSGGLSDSPSVSLGIAQACLGVDEYEEASRAAQRAIAAGGQVGIEAYAVRAEALQATGCTDLAQKHLMAALQMDPDNATLQRKMKALRRVVAETTRVRSAVDAAMNARKFDEAVRLCEEGLRIDSRGKKLLAEFHARRAKAYSMQAKQHFRLAAEESADPAEAMQACWRRCLQDSHYSMYYDSSDSALPAVFLKCEALQALGRYQEALDELESCYKNGPGEGDESVRAKHKEAQFLLKKSKRVDLYKVLGCTRGELSSEKEIKVCYKKAALKWHPDRHSGADEAKKKEVEKKFKEIADAYELLTDPQRKALYDKGYDREEIEQHMEMQNQRAQQRSHFPGRGRYYY